jgi:hypothetical protein
MALALYAIPLLLFGLGLRAGTFGKLTATMAAAPVWAVLGLQPLMAALVGGWAGVSPVAVVAAAVTGVLNCFVFVAALRGRRRLQHPSSCRAAPTP